MRLSILIFVAFSIFACQHPEKKVVAEASPAVDFEVLTTDNPELKYEQLQLFPITANADFAKQTNLENLGEVNATNLVNLGEAIGNKRFRITEKKPYGRMDDQGAVNSLTVQNKSTDVVFLMAGDVVQGGRQDRVIAQDMVIPPRTITDIEVFCVEKGRWNYVEDDEIIDDHIAQQNKKVYAFTDYYNVASNEIRKSATQSRNQQEVWDKVSQITISNKAGSDTGAYTELEQSEDYTNLRDKYLKFFQNKFEESDEIVGIVAVSGGEVLGADIFGNAELFKKQYKALIHGYITDAITNGSEESINPEKLNFFVDNLKNDYSQPKTGNKYFYNKAMIHYSML